MRGACPSWAQGWVVSAPQTRGGRPQAQGPPRRSARRWKWSSSASSSSARGPPQPGNAQAHVADSDVLAPLGHRMGLPADPRRGVPGTGRRRVPGVPPGQVSLDPCRQDQPVAVGQRRAVAGASHDAFPATQLTEAASGGRRPVRARGQRLGHDRSAGDDPARFGATGGLARPPSVANPRCAARAPVRRSAISRSGGTPCPFRARQAATARRLVATPNGGSERVLPALPVTQRDDGRDRNGPAAPTAGSAGSGWSDEARRRLAGVPVDAASALAVRLLDRRGLDARPIAPAAQLNSAWASLRPGASRSRGAPAWTRRPPVAILLVGAGNHEKGGGSGFWLTGEYGADALRGAWNYVGIYSPAGAIPAVASPLRCYGILADYAGNQEGYDPDLRCPARHTAATGAIFGSLGLWQMNNSRPVTGRSGKSGPAGLSVIFRTGQRLPLTGCGPG